jgi:serpin B
MQQTENRIDELLPGGSVSSDTRLVLVNAIYFLGTLESAFNAKATQDKDFFVDGKTAKKVPTMTKTQNYKYAKAEGFQLLEMGYDGSTLVMNLLLPDEPQGLPALEAQMSVENINTWWSKLHSQEITLELPRFELKDQRIPLKQILQALGMNAAFDEKLADFGAMAVTTPDANLYISDAFHEAFIKVDEKGTEAAAATAVLVAKPASVPSPPKMFQVKHPFLFVIRDTANGAILFMGRVTDPAP